MGTHRKAESLRILLSVDRAQNASEKPKLWLFESCREKKVDSLRAQLGPKLFVNAKAPRYGPVSRGNPCVGPQRILGWLIHLFSIADGDKYNSQSWALNNPPFSADLRRIVIGSYGMILRPMFLYSSESWEPEDSFKLWQSSKYFRAQVVCQCKSS